MQYKALITKDGWILCAKCGHKLAKEVANSIDKSNCEIELKCNSCKALNVYRGGQNV